MLRMTVRALIALVHWRTQRFIPQSPTREEACTTRGPATWIRHSGFVIPSSFVIRASSLFNAASMSASRARIRTLQRLTQTPLHR